MYICDVDVDVERPSHKEGTPDLRRHPSRHLRAEPSGRALRLEFRLIIRPRPREPGRNPAAKPKPRRIRRRVLSQ